MKKFLFLALFCACFVAAYAQINDQYAPDFTVYEIDKSSGAMIQTPITLSQYTDSGKAVFIDVFATWCSPCWGFHQSGAFESLYSQYGPDGTNEVMVFGIEGDEGNYSALTGGPDASGYASQGNWLNGVEYPIIPTYMSPNTDDVLYDYSIGYFPTLYLVCPSKWVYELDQSLDGQTYITANQLYQTVRTMCPNFNTAAEANAALSPKVEGFKSKYHCSATATPVIHLQNVAQNELTSAELIIDLDGTVSTFNWTGNLAPFEWVEVELPELQTDVNGSHTYTVTISKVNGIDDPDPLKGTATGTFTVYSTPSTSNVNATFASSIPSTWIQDNGMLSVTSGRLKFNAYQYPNGYTENLSLPPLDLTRFALPTLSFKLAHKQYNASSKERLKVSAAVNCSGDYSVLYDKIDPELATATGYSSSAYNPTTSDWRIERIDLSELPDLSNVNIKFTFISGYGNNIWIDDVKIYDGTGLANNEAEALSIYPNPVSDVIFVNAPESVSEVLIYNLQGQLVRSLKGDIHEVSVLDLSDGVYVMKVRTESGSVSTQKIVKQ